MSHFHKSDDVLGEWLAVADKATPPARAPRGSNSGTALRLAFAAAVAILLATAVLAPRVLTTNEPAVGGSPSASAPVTTSPESTPTATESTPNPTQTPQASQAIDYTMPFHTDGVTSGWKGFEWSKVANPGPLLGAADDGQIVTWARGYAFASSMGLTESGSVWTSSDGVTWTIGPEGLISTVAAGPAGLIAIVSSGGDGSDQAEWLSTDGRRWTRLSTGPSFEVMSLAGTANGYVAAGVSQSDGVHLAFSTDGASWQTVDAEPGASWDTMQQFRVQSAHDRFLLMGTLQPGSGLGPDSIILASSTLGGHVWWSDDGLHWTRSTGLDGSIPVAIDVASGGLLLHTNYNATPGGLGLFSSADDGKTWSVETNFGPLGTQPCQGECATNPDGSMSGNGTLILAVKTDGSAAWTSTDGHNWTKIPWGGPKNAIVTVLPRGALVNAPDDLEYGAAK
jgi:hypothetical protein